METLTAEDPRVIGGYELRARLGAGGFGQVYLGLSPGGRAVAVKVLRGELGRNTEFLGRFRLEVAAAQRVNGIYTAPVVAAGLDEWPPWVATAFVPGPSLSWMISRHGPLPEAALWRLLAGLVEALAAIHAAGLVHRDLKPANVMMAADGPRVIDFGISKAAEGTALTATGAVFGTPDYMAPEQAEAHEVGPATDVFALGCTLAHAATGVLPFGGGSAASVLYRVVHGTPLLEGMPPRLRTVIESCLAKGSGARPGLADLAAIGRDGPGGSRAGQSPAVFWPAQVARLVRDYQDRLEGAAAAPGLTGSVPATPAGTSDPQPHPSFPPTVSARFTASLPPPGPTPAAAWGETGNGPARRPPRPVTPAAGYQAAQPGNPRARAPQALPRPPVPGPQRRPADELHRPAVPGTVHAAVILMRLGACINGATVLLAATSTADAATVMAATARASSSGSPIIVYMLAGVIAWLVVAAKVNQGRNWARVVGTVLFAVLTALLATAVSLHLTRGAGAAYDPVFGFSVIVVWMLALSWAAGGATVVLLWLRASSQHFRIR